MANVNPELQEAVDDILASGEHDHLIRQAGLNTLLNYMHMQALAISTAHAELMLNHRELALATLDAAIPKNRGRNR